MNERTTPAKGEGGSRGDGSGNHLYVKQLNYHPNDIGELRRLAEQNPELAHKLVDNREAEHRREENSFRLGLYVSGALAIVLTCGGAYVLVNIGWWQTIVFVLVLLGTSHLTRAVLTGKFSDTSWFGKFLTGASDKDEV